MIPDWISAEFAKLRSEYFEPLCEALRLSEPDSVAGQQFAVSSAANGTVRVFFEQDRGLFHFSLGPAEEPDPWCPVDLIARRFPRVRLLGAGQQRLSLHEQVQLIQGHWAELQQMFGPALADTRDWLSQMRTAETAKHSGSG